MSYGILTGIDMTAEELLLLPRGRARFELIAGELRVMEPGGAEHGMVAVHIGALLDRHVRAGGHGRAFGAETGFIVAREPDTVRAPDAAFVTREHAERVGRIAGYWPGAPDFAVEVVSPNDSFSQVHEKALMWLEAGARLVLVADPAAARVTAYRAADDVVVLSGDEVVDCSDVVPGFAVPAGELLS